MDASTVAPDLLVHVGTFTGGAAGVADGPRDAPTEDDVVRLGESEVDDASSSTSSEEAEEAPEDECRDHATPLAPHEMPPEVGAQLRALARRASVTGILREGETTRNVVKAVVRGEVPLPAPPAAAVARADASLRADCPTRLAKFDDVYNFRDIGGFVTSDGRRLRTGLLFRSSRPDRASEGDLDLLSKVHGVRTIVDLRALEETAALTGTSGRVDLLYQSTIVEVNPRRRRHFVRRMLGFGRPRRSSDALSSSTPSSGRSQAHSHHSHHEHRSHAPMRSQEARPRLFSPRGYSPLETTGSHDALDRAASVEEVQAHVEGPHHSQAPQHPHGASIRPSAGLAGGLALAAGVAGVVGGIEGVPAETLAAAAATPLLRRVRVGFIGRDFMRNAMWSAMPLWMKVSVVFRKLVDVLFGTNYAKALVISRLINPRGIKGQYRDFVDFCKLEIACVLRFIADADALPVLVHCAHGKDRTGIVLAMTLACLGVPDEDIALDYGLSETGLGPMRDRVYEEIVSAHGLAEEFAHADPETMRATLKYVRQKYGSVRAYLVAAGFNEADQQRLRALLLEPASDHAEGFVLAGHEDDGDEQAVSAGEGGAGVRAGAHRLEE